MLEEKDVKSVARLFAIQHVAELALAMTYKAMNASPDFVRLKHNEFLKTLQGETFDETDPAQSDLLASEFEEAVRGILANVEARLSLDGNRNGQI